MPKHFVKNKEDFTCAVCGTKVFGTGYTNHCPTCLWSKHVDQEIPGDRINSCQGLMKPVGVEVVHGKYCLIHRCCKCGKMTKNKMAENDNFDQVLKTIKK